MKVRIYIAATALLLLTAPVFAADDQNPNSGFGNDLFSGNSAPAFEDPDFFDIDSLTNLAPAAGDEGNAPAKNVLDSSGTAEEGSAVGLPVPVQNATPDAPAAGGLKAIFPTR